MEDIKTKVDTILKDYIKQMRSAGFNDKTIKDKLLKTGSIFVPDEMPKNFGQTWTSGMDKEFRGPAIGSKPGTYPELDAPNIIPDPNNYMEYMPNGVVNRIPTYEEFSNRNQNVGGFRQNKNTNLMNALQRRLAGYNGPKVSPSQYAYQMGIVGMPQELANQWIPQYLQLAEQKADEAKKAEEYEKNVIEYSKYGIKVKPGDTAQDIANMIIESSRGEANKDVVKAGQDLVDDWMKAKSDYSDLFNPVDGIDPMDKIINGIRVGFSLEEIADWIVSNKVPITNQQLEGLYYLYGQ